MTVASDLSTYLDELRQAIGAALEAALARWPMPAVIDGPVRYALLGPGKRLRPCLTLVVADALAPTQGLSIERARDLAMPAACAVEMIHTYSLVHDDLPAMDDDALRRGRPTTHVIYGDGLAILAGDGLLTDAFRLLATAPADAPAERRLQAVATLASAAGSTGMVGGQAIDLMVAGQTPEVASTLEVAGLEDMHGRKTGAMIGAAAALGAIMVGASDRLMDAVAAYGRELGLAFQIVDDILDVEESTAALGKTAGKDLAAGKPTFPALLGLAESRGHAASRVLRAKAALRDVGLGGRLDELAEWSLTRRK